MDIFFKIKKYLENGTLAQGIELLKMLNHTAEDVRFFENYKGATYIDTSVFERLDMILNSYLSSLEQPKNTPPSVSVQVDKIIEKINLAQTQNEAEPEAVRALRLQLIKSMKERAAYHAQLENLTKNSDRADVAERVLELTEEIDKVSRQIQTWETDKILPIVVEKTPDTEGGGVQDAVSLYKRRKYLIERKSKLCKELSDKDLGESRRNRVLNFLEEVNAEFEKINNILNPKETE